MRVPKGVSLIFAITERATPQDAGSIGGASNRKAVVNRAGADAEVLRAPTLPAGM